MFHHCFFQIIQVHCKIFGSFRTVYLNKICSEVILVNPLTYWCILSCTLFCVWVFLFLVQYYGSDGKESACSVGDPGSIPGLGRSPGEGNGSPLQYPCLENPMDKRAWYATASPRVWGGGGGGGGGAVTSGRWGSSCDRRSWSGGAAAESSGRDSE